MNAEDIEKSDRIAVLTLKVAQVAESEARKLTSVEDEVFVYSTIALSSAFASIFKTGNKEDYLGACEHAWRTSRDLRKVFERHEKERSKRDLN